MAEHSTTEIVTGAAVLVLAGGFLAYALQSTGASFGGGESYDVTASFRAVDGVTPGTEVRMAGVKIGSVQSLALNAETFRADMLVSIDADVKLPEDSSIAITSEGLLGGNYVEIVPGGSPFNLDPGAEIEDTQGSISLIGLLAKFVSGRDE